MRAHIDDAVEEKQWMLVQSDLLRPIGKHSPLSYYKRDVWICIERLV